MTKKIDVTQLRKGMFICGTDRKWIDIPFFRKKFLITSDKQISTLQEYCEFVYIDTEKGVDVSPAIIEQHNDDTFVDLDSSKQIHEDTSYRKNYEDSQTILSEVLNDVRLGRCVDNPKVRGVVQELIVNIVKDSQSMIGLIQSKDKNDTLARKSVNVCILALAFGKHIGIPKDKMYELGLGALLHDIGMVQIPNRILLKKQPLTPAERTIMEKHTEYGLAILAKTQEIPVNVLKIVHSHHERMDGKGYPQKLQDKEIGLLVRMVTIVSVYEALTRERFYTETLSPVAALKYLYTSGKAIFDAPLVEKFIQALGIYPSGCVVVLNSGEIGVVVNVNPQDRLRPTLRIVTNAQKQLLAQESVLELADRTTKDIEIIKTLAMDDPIIELLMTLHEQVKGGANEAVKLK
ncbi:putative nucleotidyltransferase with HDIG domain [Methylobacter tundripaludum]|uniref:Putative nucleotidyltransferase with HDIG domain n=1 Tax=Methylobacter tundripaludum TaxID=173365 RepID=A0A2S6HBR7_9GAMM|nr:HD-GYP domain-containing protein [Methylobacter tundripaludum]PPK74892.1 putative nucleotidyltransferase with HDIG domain [Methylobacter tundripaludum]